jgi:hypothetical protein
MPKLKALATAVFFGGVCGSTSLASAQMPDYNSLSKECQGLYNEYIDSYNDYADYYSDLHQQYPDGNNPDDTADTLGQKIDHMYDNEDAFEKDCGQIDAFSRGSKVPPPNKINLKSNRKR